MLQLPKLLHYELLMVKRHFAEWLNPWLFFIIVLSLFPLASGTEMAAMQNNAPGIVWIALSLAVLLSLDNLFRSDYEEGILTQWCISRQSLVVLIVVRIMVSSCAILFPLAVALPIVGLFLQWDFFTLCVLFVSACLAIPTLLLIGGLGAALTLTLPRGGTLIALLILPLYIPVILFAAGALVQANAAFSIMPTLAILGVFAVLAVIFIPFLIAMLLRNE